MMYVLFFFNDTATTEIYTLSLHDALPISVSPVIAFRPGDSSRVASSIRATFSTEISVSTTGTSSGPDRKSTRLNSSHANISYAVFCLKKKQKHMKLRK